MSSQTDQQVGALYLSHHSWLCAWLSRRLGNSADVADIAQDTFMRILNSTRRSDTTILEPNKYLVTVAKGILVNWYQRKALEKAYMDALVGLPEPEVPSPEQRYIILETLQEIDAMLDSLSPRIRNTFLLSQLDGLKYEEIAKQLEISLSSVKRYMKQAFLHCLMIINAQEPGHAEVA